MELPGPDPETMKMATRLRAALTLVVSSGRPVEAAFDIAHEMASRRLVDGRPEVVVALTLFELSLQHLERTPSTPDPYAPLSRRLVADGYLHPDDVSTAVYGRILSTGLVQGWLHAQFYDEVAAFGGRDPQLRALLAQIERRVLDDHHGTTPPRSSAKPSPLPGRGGGLIDRSTDSRDISP